MSVNGIEPCRNVDKGHAVNIHIAHVDETSPQKLEISKGCCMRYSLRFPIASKVEGIQHSAMTLH